MRIRFDGATGADDRLRIINSDATTWRITSAYAGRVNYMVDFAGIENLDGDKNSDTFSFSDGIYYSGAITGGDGYDTINYAAHTTPVAIVLLTDPPTERGGFAGGFAGIEAFIGGSATDSLVGPDTVNIWRLTGRNMGSVAGFRFASVENLIGGEAADTFVFVRGARVTGTITGGDGNDTLNYSAYFTSIMLDLQTGTGTGASTFRGIESVLGGAGRDRLTGGAASVRFDGREGNDTLIGGSRGDMLLGGAGDDCVRGGNGNDTIRGSTGNDRLYGDAGNDLIWAESGNDQLFAGLGLDTLDGGAGTDSATGGRVRRNIP
jgi:Ca2+-binding RTX toxin-like protein